MKLSALSIAKSSVLFVWFLINPASTFCIQPRVAVDGSDWALSHWNTVS